MLVIVNNNIIFRWIIWLVRIFIRIHITTRYSDKCSNVFTIFLVTIQTFETNMFLFEAWSEDDDMSQIQNYDTFMQGTSKMVTSSDKW